MLHISLKIITHFISKYRNVGCPKMVDYHFFRAPEERYQMKELVEGKSMRKVEFFFYIQQ